MFRKWLAAEAGVTSIEYGLIGVLVAVAIVGAVTAVGLEVGAAFDYVAVMLARYRDVCEKEGILFAAPSTNSGAEWWTPDGRRVIRWMIEELELRYSLDEDRIALMGAMDGGSACWLLGQEMPDTFSCLMPMSGNPIEMAESFRPLFMGVLDRTDILMGVCGKDNGGWDLAPYLDALKLMFELFQIARRDGSWRSRGTSKGPRSPRCSGSTPRS